MVTRKQLHAFQRNQITLILANGSKIVVPAMNVVAALLNVITPDQRRRVLEQCVGQGDAPWSWAKQSTYRPPSRKVTPMASIPSKSPAPAPKPAPPAAKPHSRMTRGTLVRNISTK